MPAISSSQRRADRNKVADPTSLHGRLLESLARRPAGSAACAVFAALMTGVLINALAFQNARHPSPLFSAPVTVAPSAPAEAELPKPIPRPAAIAPPPASLPSSPTAIAARPVAAVPHEALPPAETKAPDTIGQMLRGSNAAPSAIDATRILLVQKALMKLGYVVRPDGVMGVTTRQAIEKFERERGWPARGELTAKVMREISARSGLPIE